MVLSELLTRADWIYTQEFEGRDQWEQVDFPDCLTKVWSILVPWTKGTYLTFSVGRKFLRIILNFKVWMKMLTQHVYFQISSLTSTKRILFCIGGLSYYSVPIQDRKHLCFLEILSCKNSPAHQNGLASGPRIYETCFIKPEKRGFWQHCRHWWFPVRGGEGIEEIKKSNLKVLFHHMAVWSFRKMLEQDLETRGSGWMQEWTEHIKLSSSLWDGA